MASLPERDTIVPQRQGDILLEETMETDNQVRFDDPQFTKLLETCLKMEIVACREKFEANSTKIKMMKIKMRHEINKRKQLKEKMVQIHKIKVRLSESLTRLHISNSEMTDKLDIMKANFDDQYKLMELREQEYQDIIAEYKNTSDDYHAQYEEFPLAKTRKAAKIKLEKLRIAYMDMTYKKTEMMTIIKQRRRIDWIRMRYKIIEFAHVMTERLRFEEKLTRLKVNVDYHRRELRSIEIEMQVQRKRLEDQRRLRKQKMLEMPPKINIPNRQMYAQACKRFQQQWMQPIDTFDDTVSINTVVLEELCVNENTLMSTEIIDVESVQDKDPKCPTVVQTESPNPKGPAVSEKTDTRAASVAPDVEVNAAEEVASADNDVEMKETHQEETRQPQTSTKTRPSLRTKEHLLKHSAAKSTQDEIEAKRMRLQREDSKGSSSNRINVGPSTVVRENDAESLKSSTSAPKIRKIETVHYNVAVLPKPVPWPSGARSSIFSPPRYEYCESNMSSFDQDFPKGPVSYDGSLCDYRLSPVCNVSPMCFEKKAPTVPLTNLWQQDDKNQSNDKASLFDFDNFMKKDTGNFTLF